MNIPDLRWSCKATRWIGKVRMGPETERNRPYAHRKGREWTGEDTQ